METVRLHVLGIDVQLKRHQSFYNDGVVDDLIGAVEKLSESYQDETSLSYLYKRQLLDGEIPKGACLVFASSFWPLVWDIHILCEDQGDEMLNTETMAHEETHVVDKTSNLRVLERKIAHDGFRLKTRLKRLDRESVAGIGGLYALLARGFSVQEIRARVPDYLTEELKYFEGVE